jgi:hypothetical protein
MNEGAVGYISQRAFIHVRCPRESICGILSTSHADLPILERRKDMTSSARTYIGYGLTVPSTPETREKLLTLAHEHVQGFKEPPYPECVEEWINPLVETLFPDLIISRSVNNYFDVPYHIFALAKPGLITIDSEDSVASPVLLSTGEGEDWNRAFSQLSLFGQTLGLPATNGETPSGTPDTYGWIVRSDLF